MTCAVLVNGRKSLSEGSQADMMELVVEMKLTLVDDGCTCACPPEPAAE
jgi:hypothetical protein